MKLGVGMGRGDGLVLVSGDHIFLYIEDKTRDQDVDDCNRRCQVDVSGSAICKLDQRGKHVVVGSDSDDGRDSVVSNGSDENKQCGSTERRNDQRKCDGPHDPGLAGSHEHCGFLKKSVGSAEGSVGHLEDERVIGQGHTQDHSEHAVDARDFDSERTQKPVQRHPDYSLVSQKDDPRVCTDERGHDDRQDSEGYQELLAGDLDACDAVSHRHSYQDA